MHRSMRLRFVLMTALVAAPLACAPKGPIAFVDDPLPLLVWLGEATRASGFSYPDIPAEPKYGSLSGLAPDLSRGQWIGVIDDRERTRVVWLGVSYSDTGFSIAPVKVQELRAAPGVDERIVTQADLEAIVARPDGSFVLAEEGHVVEETGGVWQPALLQMRDGVVSNVINFPREFQITADGKSGVRDNQGFEGLAITPGGRLIAGLEQPLIEDGVVTFDRPAAGRLVEFVPDGRSYKPGRQWRYMIAPTPRIEGFDDTCGDGENGLVELLGLSETTLISMERACLMSKDQQFVANTVQLYSVELIGGEARKRLLLDFKDLEPRLRAVLPRLENFEALAFGPIVGGMKTLLIGSDDNFRATQKTSFLLLGMK
jgi:hypothetical protein